MVVGFTTTYAISAYHHPDIPPFFTGTLIVMGVLIFFKKKTGLSPSQAIATKNGNACFLHQ
jgi:uncharacterized membrane protein YjjP (DUF1212 family)